MQHSIWMAMFGFALSMSISPGPVNMLIIATAAQQGFARTWALVSGATLGFTALLALVGMGLSELLQQYPLVLHVLGILGAVFMLWVGWCLWRAPTAPLQTDVLDADAVDANVTDTNVTDAAPVLPVVPGFWHGVLLQCLNPKAWIACAAGTAMFASAPVAHALTTFVAIYFVVCYASLALWAWAGQQLAAYLQVPRRMRVFNVMMAAMMWLTAAVMLWQQLTGLSGL